MSIFNGHNEDSSGNILLSIGNGMTATLESGTTASQAYTKGSYVFFDNKLCKVTQDITSGTTLEIGTNLAQTSIGTELTSHLRSNDGKEFYFDVKDGSYGFYPSASKVAEEFVPFGGTPIADELVKIDSKNGYNSSLGGHVYLGITVNNAKNYHGLLAVSYAMDWAGDSGPVNITVSGGVRGQIYACGMGVVFCGINISDDTVSVSSDAYVPGHSCNSQLSVFGM